LAAQNAQEANCLPDSTIFFHIPSYNLACFGNQASRPIALGSVQDESHVLHLICLLKLHDIYDNYLLFGRPHTAGVSGMEDANHMHLLYATSAFFTRCFATGLANDHVATLISSFFLFLFWLCASLISSLTFYCCGG
jgi:hypothetical protein